MIARAILRDLGALAAAAALVILLIAAAGTLAALAVLLIVIPLALGVIGLALFIIGLVEAVNSTDDTYARVDRELDQEHEARRKLRVQRTVQAEPMAPVVDIRTRETVA